LVYLEIPYSNYIDIITYVTTISNLFPFNVVRKYKLQDLCSEEGNNFLKPWIINPIYQSQGFVEDPEGCPNEDVDSSFYTPIQMDGEH